MICSIEGLTLDSHYEAYGNLRIHKDEIMPICVDKAAAASEKFKAASGQFKQWKSTIMAQCIIRG